MTKSLDFHPKGILQLGQILAEPKDPIHALQPAGPLPLHEELTVEHTFCQEIDVQLDNELSAQYNAWASFVLASANTTASSSRFNKFSWHFDRLDNHTMTPSLKYVKEAMTHGDVPESLRKWSFTKRVYMVTGIRIASGARMERSSEAKNELSTAATVSPSTGVDQIGAGAGMTSSSTNAESVGSASDFVFAYRLNEVRYWGKITHKPYGGGELSSATGTVKPAKTELYVEDFEVLELSEDSWKGNLEDFDLVAVPSHGDLECYCSKGQ